MARSANCVWLKKLSKGSCHLQTSSYVSSLHQLFLCKICHGLVKSGELVGLGLRNFRSFASEDAEDDWESLKSEDDLEGKIRRT